MSPLYNLLGELMLDDTGQQIDIDINTGNGILLSIAAAVADLDGNTDQIEALLAAIAASVADLDGNTATIDALLTSIDGHVAAIDSNTDQLETLVGVSNASLADIDANTDGIETELQTANAILADIELNTDQVEAILTTISNAVADLDGNTDQIEALITATNVLLTTISGNTDQIEGYVDQIESLIGVTNTTLTDGTQRTQVVDPGGQALDIAATGAALTRLDRNAQLVDAAAYAQLTDTFVMVGGLVSGGAIGGAAAIRTATRAWLVEWVNAAGQGMGTTTAPVVVDSSKIEDAAHASGDRGAFILGVRNDADTTLTNNTGDYSPIATDLAGRIKAVISSSALPTGAATEATSAAILAAVDQLEGYLDAVEGLITTGNATAVSILAAVDQIEGYVDGIEGLITSGNASLASILTSVDGLEALLTTTNSLIGNQLRASTSTLSSVAASASSVQLLAANANRVGVTIFNDSTTNMFVKEGTTASLTSFSYRIAPFGHLELPTPCYSGRVDAIWLSATGSARITERTP